MTETESTTPPTAEAPAIDSPPRDGRRFLFAGMGLIALAFLLSWWSLTKYRVPEERSIAPEKIGAVDGGLDDEAKKTYHDNLGRYRQSWEDNRKQYGEYYREHFGDNFETEIRLQDARNWKSGTISLGGYSTWTGWFGATFALIMVAALVAPKFVPTLEAWSWGFPWAGVILFGLYALMALVFYFSVPDENGDGYSQGVGLGNYLAIIGGCLATAGCVFEGMRSIDQGIAAMKARAESAEEEDDDDEPKPVAPPPTKSRLQDW